MRFSRSVLLLMCFSFGDLTSIIRTGWLILVELVGMVNSYNSQISNDLTQLVNFPTSIPYCDSHSPVLLDFFLVTLWFVPKWLSLHWGVLIMSLSFYWRFIELKKGCPILSPRLCLSSGWLGWSLWSFERCSMGGYL